ncbi:DedA family protein [Raineyella sp. LH-20]|uniref:DedA family protein n=1 Tax=Raineyella sp. LH-20 TaxID=3081204 RepID=UPI00295419B8|nr:DedA family protein [Raineyella sp. LH-20]WOP17759.1 DedA family protein [Raineyella sp. LH-20]
MGWISTIVEWVTRLMQTIGGPGVFLAILLENVFPPIPSEVILPLAGFTAAGPDAPYGLVEAIVWASAGSLTGALLLYWLGAAIGAERLRWIAERIPLVDAHDVDSSIDWFTRYGSFAVLIGRLVPGVRSLISIPAGIDRMPLLKFSAFTVLGSVIWNTALVVAGYLLGDNWHAVSEWMDRFSTVVYAVLGVAFVALTVWLVRRALVRRAVRRRDSSDTDDTH